MHEFKSLGDAIATLNDKNIIKQCFIIRSWYSAPIIRHLNLLDCIVQNRYLGLSQIKTLKNVNNYIKRKHHDTMYIQLFINSEFIFTFNDYKPQDTPESSAALQSWLNHPLNGQLNMLDSFPPHRTSSIIMFPFPWPKWALLYDFAVLKIIEMNLKKKTKTVYMTGCLTC